MDSTTTIHSFSLVLPSKNVPVALSHLTRPLTQKFLVKYRNILVQSPAGVSWGLAKDSNYCGKAFTIEISQAQAHNIQLIKQAGEMIEVVGQNYILLKIEKQVQKPTHPLTQQQIHTLLEDIGGNNRANVSLLKSAFDSYEDYRNITEDVRAIVDAKEAQKEISVAEKIQLQFNAKKLSGKSLFQVPMMLKETGNWSDEQTIELKLSNS